MQAFEDEPTTDRLEAQAMALEQELRMDEALQHYKRVFAARERLLGPHAPKTLQSGVGVARCLSGQGHHRDALPYCERALDWIRSNPSKIDPSSSNGVKRLHGRILRGLDRLDAAAAEYRGMLSPDLQGEERTMTLNELAGVCLDAGRSEEALGYYWEAYDGVVKSHGSESTLALTMLNNIANAQLDAGHDSEMALELFQKVYDGYLKTCGETHPNTIKTATSITSSLYLAGNLTEAEIWGRRTLRISERAFGEENQPTLSTANTLGIILNQLHKYDEAEDVLRDCLSGLTKLYGANHTMTLTTRSNLAGAIRGSGDLQGALNEQLAVYSGISGSLGPGHPSSRKVIQEVIRLQDELGLFGEAVKNQELLLAEMMKLGPPHSGHALCMAKLVTLYQKNGDAAKAKATEDRLAQLRQEIQRRGGA